MAWHSVPRKEIADLIGRAKYAAAVAVPVLAISCVLAPIHWPSLVGGAVLGLVGFVCAIISWRWYHPWLSWLCWAIPVAAGYGVLLGYYSTTGEASSLNLVGQALWAGMAVFFSLLWLFRRNVIRWIGAHANA